MRTRVKICGITRVEDGVTAVAEGVDAIGLVFYAPSPRNISIETAVRIVEALPAFITVTALFVNADTTTIAQVVDNVGIDLIQFHGDESADYCQSHGKPWIKAIRMKDDIDLVATTQQYKHAKAILLDAYQAGVPGGTGACFDWERIPGNLDKPIILAGGLVPDNVTTAIQTVHPYAVDVSGGVERDKGIKDPRKIAAFMNGVGRAK